MTMTDTTIRPFEVHVPDEDLADLRRRVAATQWPEKETVADQSQGVPLATMQELARYWATGYDWRRCEARLNALPQFMTEIDGLDIHFIHVRSQHEDALPLIINHGWPGSVIEQLKIIDLLTDPTAHGATAADAFHLVIPSLPGFGFSGKPTATGWGPERIARAWVVLMQRLGYAQFVAQGGDVGAGVCTAMAKQTPPQLLGIHTNFPGDNAARCCTRARGGRFAAVSSVGRRATRLRSTQASVHEAARLRQHDGDAAANAVRTCGFAHRPRHLDGRSWRRLRPAGGVDYFGHSRTYC